MMEQQGQGSVAVPAPLAAGDNNDVVVVVADRQSTADAGVVCSMLCDTHLHPDQANHRPVVRVVAEDPKQFLSLSSSKEGNKTTNSHPISTSWKCHENTSNPPSYHWTPYLGTPDVVLPLSQVENAIIGNQILDDDGGMAYTVILCANLSQKSGREILQNLYRAIAMIMENDQSQIGKGSNNTNHRLPFFKVVYTGSFRELSFCLPSVVKQLQQEHENNNFHNQRIGFGAFAAPLRYARMIQKGLVLSVLRTCQSPRFLVATVRVGSNNKTMQPYHRRHNKNNNIKTGPLFWNQIVEWLISPLSSSSSNYPTLHRLVVPPSFMLRRREMMGMPNNLSLRKEAAKSIIVQLQDPTSILILPCLLATSISLSRKQQRLAGLSSDKINYLICMDATNFVMSLIEEIYLLFAELLQTSNCGPDIMRHDNLLTDLVGTNQTILELTNNTGEEIVERVLSQQGPILQYKWILRHYIYKTIQKEFDGFTSLSPFQTPPTQEQQHHNPVLSSVPLINTCSKEIVLLQTYVSNHKLMIMEGGLLQIISCGQLILGTNRVTQDLKTTIKVVKILEPYLLDGAESYFQIIGSSKNNSIPNSTVIWDTNIRYNHLLFEGCFWMLPVDYLQSSHTYLMSQSKL